MILINLLREGIKYLSDSDYRFMWNAALHLYDKMPDEKYLRKLYKARMGRELNLENPTRLSEKLQWMKLYDRNPEYTKLADKYTVKKIVGDKIGQEYVLPVFGVWDHFDEINFNELPDQFILKCTHNSGYFAIAKNKDGFDKRAAKRLLERGLRKNYFYRGREFAYRDIPPRIIAEKYIPSLGQPNSIEYKLTCFNGKVHLITICKGIAHSSLDARTNDNYDRDFNYLPFYAFYKNTSPVDKPKEIDQLIELSEILAKDLTEARVDWYVDNGQIYFGEITFYTWNGFIEFSPPEWDEILGKKLQLPVRQMI